MAGKMHGSFPLQPIKKCKKVLAGFGFIKHEKAK